MEMNIDSLIKVVEATVKRKKLQLERFKRFDVWLENNDFDDLLYRIILEIKADEYSLYGMNNKLHFILEYVMHYYNSHIVLDINKKTPIYKFENFYFEIYQEQGAVVNIYNCINKNCLISL